MAPIITLSVSEWLILAPTFEMKFVNDAYSGNDTFDDEYDAKAVHWYNYWTASPISDTE
jgi:hypothetical protein